MLPDESDSKVDKKFSYSYNVFDFDKVFKYHF